MRDNLDAGPLADYPLPVVFRAALAENLMAFTEFAFGVVRPGVCFKPNWHLEAITEKLSQVASGRAHRAARLCHGGGTPICRCRGPSLASLYRKRRRGGGERANLRS